ncbi:MAG: hypothetical protein AB7L41_16535 [Flavobacteriaceae bacterium]
MPQLFLIGLGALVVAGALKLLRAEQNRVADRLDRAERGDRDRGIDLEQDGETGEYRPRR